MNCLTTNTYNLDQLSDNINYAKSLFDSIDVYMPQSYQSKSHNYMDYGVSHKPISEEYVPDIILKKPDELKLARDNYYPSRHLPDLIYTSFYLTCVSEKIFPDLDENLPLGVVFCVDHESDIIFSIRDGDQG